MSSFKNTRQFAYLQKLPHAGLENEHCTLTSRCKFNFSYFDPSQTAGQNYKDWGLNGLDSLLKKLTEYSKESLQYWIKQDRLSIYQKFPSNSDFSHPKFVPHDVHWARFRLEGAVRLAGFVVPGEFQNKKHERTNKHFDCNTFYVVFLDENHAFYKLKKK